MCGRSVSGMSLENHIVCNGDYSFLLDRHLKLSGERRTGQVGSMIRVAISQIMREFLNPPGAVERNLACNAVNRPHKQIAEADSPGHNRQYDKIINPAAFLEELLCQFLATGLDFCRVLEESVIDELLGRYGCFHTLHTSYTLHMT